VLTRVRWTRCVTQVAKIYVSFFGAWRASLPASISCRATRDTACPRFSSIFRPSLSLPLPCPPPAGDARGADQAFAGLQRLEPYLRSQVGKAMQMRHVPELRFFRDEGAERGGRIMTLLADLRSEAATDAASALGAAAPPARAAAGAARRSRGSPDLLASSVASSSDSEASDVDEPLLEYDSAEDDIILIDERA
jgi:ribosome-binding factor A